ncbi:MAG: serine/threonine protein kinase, partial [Phycisphaerales bacterium]|nr:serine/threonine protein kinase [Phycisphaerales bacterium]
MSGQLIGGERVGAVPGRIGPYRVLGQIGAGGMGMVLKASHDTEPGRKLVAIKLVRGGADTGDVLERFAVERQVLSGLNHPNIARFHEAGETEDGRPYFVMEYVEGQSLTAYCDANNLPITDRLRVFGKVCDAVQYAHTNLVVHRDLKPENIIVTPGGEPKLRDFGIAKLINPQLAAVVAITGPMMRLMTPEYASPEQVRGEPISTLTDVYSLGVLLYELLSGHRPYRLASRLEHEIVRVICESDPDRPSTAISRVAEVRGPDGSTSQIDPQTVAQRRRGRPEALRRLLSGDLDDIILHAMSKAPAERYASVHDLAEDISLFLRGEPVKAHKARRRALYVARKFARRHRTLVTASVAALAAFVVMGGVAFWQYRSAAESDLAAARAALLAAEAKNRDLVRGAFGNVLWEKFSNRIIDVNLPPESREALWSGIVDEFEALRDEHGQDNPIVLVELAKALKELGDVLGGRRTGNVGDSQGALKSYTRASEIFATLAESHPDDVELLYRSAVSMIYKG